MQGNSTPIKSSQTGIHNGLQATLERHFQNAFNKPVSEHTAAAFRNLPAHVHTQAKHGVVLDSGCGTGASSLALAHKHRETFVIGIDKSASRLRQDLSEENTNCFLLRAEAGDFWRLAAAANWRIKKHYLLYPNPWPKPGHLQRRWHGSPIFPQLLQLGGELELRSNWQTYMLEFQQALTYAGIQSSLQQLPFGDGSTAAEPMEPISPFEAKYQTSGHSLWRLTANIANAKVTG